MYGLIAGATYTLLAWGLDAFQLANAHADLFWVKLAVGGAVCLGVSLLVGWLGQKIDNSVVTVLMWLAAGILFAWVASHLPFEIQSRVATWIDPRLAGSTIYPYPDNINARMIIIYAMTVIMFGIGGMFEMILVEAAENSASNLLRGLLLAICIPFFALAGGTTDDINQPLRDPIVNLSQTIQYAEQQAGKPVDETQARANNLHALDPVKDLIGRPYRLVLGSYEPEYLSSATIFIDFGDQWAICNTINGDPTYCEPSQTAYLDQIGCLFAYPGQDAATACRFHVSPEADQILRQWKEKGAGTVQVGVLDQRGEAILATVSGPGGSLQCQIGGAAPSYELDSCSPTQGAVQAASSISPQAAIGTATQAVIFSATQTAISAANQRSILPTFTSTAEPSPSPASTATPIPPTSQVSTSTDQAQAMLPAFQTDLQSLHNLSHYDLKAQFDPAQLRYQGQEQVTYTNTASVPLDSLYFRLFPNGGASYGYGSLSVSQVTSSGSPLATSLSVRNSALQVKLPQPLQPGSAIRLDLDFKGTVPSGPTDLGYGIFSSRDDTMILDGWFPLLAVYENCASNYDEKCWHLDPVSNMGDSVYSRDSYFDVTLSVPTNEILATTGSTLSKDTQGDQTTYQIASGPARDFLVTMSPNFQVDSQDVGGVKVNSYSLPGNEAGGKAALKAAAGSLKNFDATFGDYPYREFDVIETPLKNALGVEFPGIILIASSIYTDTQSNTFTGVVAHEVAHQWWYGLVGDDVYADPWMDEALASYSAAAYFESLYGPNAYQGYMDYYQQGYSKYLESHPDEGVATSLTHFEQASDPEGYSAIVYDKGALFFDAVRKEIGDQAFYQALRTYLQAHKYGVARPQDLESAFEQASGKNLQELYKKWLEQ